ncbi:CocE/NonD family hydrolase [Lentzea tibetensis]|uniref:CocE/NonD family hydrolase n=1 Tax=Lentzea tibetensis TaxID=2591470 RepID=UPI001648227A|nr:CocE/NonD family hydrolase [Lentzea tibetensis]
MKTLVTLLLLGLTPPSPAAPQLTQPIYSYADAIRETVYVESTIDGDGDGRLDRIVADVIRPRTTKKIPVLMGASPYHAPWSNMTAFNEDQVVPHDSGHKDLVDDGHPDLFPYFYDNYFVPRGYAVVAVDMAGTRFSEGCPDLGGPNEVLGTKAVIDWLGGRAKAFDRDGRRVTPDWTTGNVGMYGTSWDGTLPQYVATTDVPNLKTIVPNGAISSWYDYTRVDGIKRSPDHADWLADLVMSTQSRPKCAEEHAELVRRAEQNADYNSFWAERNITDDAHKVKAAVFAIHGLNDTNVTTRHFSRWWQNLKAPRKLWLSQSGHANPHYFAPDRYVATVHRWFDHWLRGIDTGIMREPAVDVERSPQIWESSRTWPVPGTQRTIALGGQVFTDDPELTRDQLVGPEGEGHRLLHVTEPLTSDSRMSGTPKITLRVSANVPNTPLNAFLVDLGEDTRVVDDGWGLQVVAGPERCFGEGLGADTGCYRNYEYATKTAPYRIVTRGTLDAAHRYTLSRAFPLTPGVPETFRWELQPNDYVFKAGHRIGVVIAANNAAGPSWPYRPAQPSGEITVRSGSISLPIARR